jgi:putative flippase GtrA
VALASQKAVLASWRDRAEPMAHAVADGDEAGVLAILTELSDRHPRLAPLTFAFGGIAMLLAGLRVLFENWRLTLVQVLPAMWVWAAMYDLRLHLLRENSTPGLKGAVLVPIVLAIVAGTIACYFLNAVFAFAVAQPGRPDVRRAIGEASRHRLAILLWGTAVGIALGLTTTVVTRADPPWFVVSLGIVVAVLMVTYVAVPARMLGVTQRRSRRDRLSASVVGGALGVLLSGPPYLLGRIGLLMIGSPILLVPGILLFALGAVLQAGATSAVKAVKVSAKLVTAEPGTKGGGEAGSRGGG